MKTEIYPLGGIVGSIKNGNLNLKKTFPSDLIHLVEYEELPNSRNFLNEIQISFQDNKIIIWINKKLDGKIVTILNETFEYHDFLEKIEKSFK